MVHSLIAAVLALATPAAGQASAPAADISTPANPAMFVVRDGDTTVYLFGTFHALDGKTAWFDASVRDAFESSDELVLETLIPEGPLPTAPEVPPVVETQVAPSASVLATARMADAGKGEDMQVGNGADMVLRHTAEREGKPVAALETMESQLTMFTRMAGKAGRAQLASQAQSKPSDQALASAMSAMQSAWARGDQTVFVSLLDQLSRSSPATYKMLFIDRNGRWADWVAARMQTPGVVFVAVGAGHLAGPDSLLVQLAQRGIPSRRVN